MFKFLYSFLDEYNLEKESINSYINRHKNKGIANASILLLNWQTMEVESYIGSSDYFNNDIRLDFSDILCYTYTYDTSFNVMVVK